MGLQETLIYINRPIDEIAADIPSHSHVEKIVEGNEVCYLVGGVDNPSFGLSADLDAPDGAVWTQLLASSMEPQSLAGLLQRLKVGPEEILPATDWDGLPLIDLKPIKARLDSRTGHRSMTKTGLVASVSEVAGLDTAIARAAVDAVINVIADQLKRGDEVRLVGFGSFRVAKRAAKHGRNPRTGEKLQVEPRSVPQFSPGKELKDAVK